MNKLFKFNTKVTTTGAPEAKIIWHKAPFTQFEKIRLNGNFKEYLETAIKSKYQKKYFQLELKKSMLKVLPSKYPCSNLKRRLCR